MEDKPLWPIFVYIISIIYKVILKYFRILVEGSHFAGGSRRVASPKFGHSVQNLGIRNLNFCSGQINFVNWISVLKLFDLRMVIFFVYAYSMQTLEISACFRASNPNLQLVSERSFSKIFSRNCQFHYRTLKSSDTDNLLSTKCLTRSFFCNKKKFKEKEKKCCQFVFLKDWVY